MYVKKTHKNFYTITRCRDVAKTRNELNSVCTYVWKKKSNILPYFSAFSSRENSGSEFEKIKMRNLMFCPISRCLDLARTSSELNSASHSLLVAPFACNM